jgi:hypothetical protein
MFKSNEIGMFIENLLPASIHSHNLCGASVISTSHEVCVYFPHYYQL